MIFETFVIPIFTRKNKYIPIFYVSKNAISVLSYHQFTRFDTSIALIQYSTSANEEKKASA